MERVQDEWKYFIFYVRQSSIFVSLLLTCYALIHVCVWVGMSVCVCICATLSIIIRNWSTADGFENGFFTNRILYLRCLFPLILFRIHLSRKHICSLSLSLTVSEWVFLSPTKRETHCMKHSRPNLLRTQVKSYTNLPTENSSNEQLVYRKMVNKLLVIRIFVYLFDYLFLLSLFVCLFVRLLVHSFYSFITDNCFVAAVVVVLSIAIYSM